jgi:hypothetical protein
MAGGNPITDLIFCWQFPEFHHFPIQENIKLQENSNPPEEIKSGKSCRTLAVRHWRSQSGASVGYLVRDLEKGSKFGHLRERP